MSIAPYSTYEAADGWLNIAVANDKLWRFCSTIDRPDLVDNPLFESNTVRVKHVDLLDIELNKALQQQSVSAWVDRLTEAGIPAGPVLTLDQVLTHAQLQARNMLPQMEHPIAGPIRMTGIPHRLSATPGQLRLPPPELGEHSQEILRELGLSQTQICTLESDGVIYSRPSTNP